MALTAPSREALDFATRVAIAYAKLLASGRADPESGLGGRLFYAGALDEKGRSLVVAANIAGAATLAASPDRAAQKQAIRDGVADFLVNSLDEALRILKNQLRKREAVAVSVAIEPAQMEREMNERGVAPDLVRSYIAIASEDERPASGGAELAQTPTLVIWRAASARHQDLALLDQIAIECVDPYDWAARRWLRLAPRYLGRMAQGLRLLPADREFAARFEQLLAARAARGEIAFPCEIRSYIRGTDNLSLIHI